jgi:hypothetical protein
MIAYVEPGGRCQRRLVWRTLRIQACSYADVASIAESGAAWWAEWSGSEVACSSLEVKRGGVVKTRIARWAGRWRERRLVRKQTRQTSAARQAKRAAEAGRSHPMGQGGSGGG